MSCGQLDWYDSGQPTSPTHPLESDDGMLPTLSAAEHFFLWLMEDHQLVSSHNLHSPIPAEVPDRSCHADNVDTS